MPATGEQQSAEEAQTLEAIVRTEPTATRDAGLRFLAMLALLRRRRLRLRERDGPAWHVDLAGEPWVVQEPDDATEAEADFAALVGRPTESEAA